MNTLELEMNTCVLIKNIWYRVLGAILSANLCGDKFKCYDFTQTVLFFRHVPAGFTNTVSKFFPLHPKPFDFDH